MCQIVKSPIAPIGAQSQPLISSRIAGEIIGRTRWTVARLVRSGELKPAGKVDGQTGAYLFHRADVEALAAKLATAEDGAA